MFEQKKLESPMVHCTREVMEQGKIWERSLSNSEMEPIQVVLATDLAARGNWCYLRLELIISLSATKARGGILLIEMDVTARMECWRATAFILYNEKGKTAGFAKDAGIEKNLTLPNFSILRMVYSF